MTDHCHPLNIPLANFFAANDVTIQPIYIIIPPAMDFCKSPFDLPIQENPDVPSAKQTN